MKARHILITLSFLTLLGTTDTIAFEQTHGVVACYDEKTTVFWCEYVGSDGEAVCMEYSGLYQPDCLNIEIPEYCDLDVWTIDGRDIKCND